MSEAPEAHQLHSFLFEQNDPIQHFKRAQFVSRPIESNHSVNKPLAIATVQLIYISFTVLDRRDDLHTYQFRWQEACKSAYLQDENIDMLQTNGDVTHGRYAFQKLKEEQMDKWKTFESNDKSDRPLRCLNMERIVTSPYES